MIMRSYEIWIGALLVRPFTQYNTAGLKMNITPSVILQTPPTPTTTTTSFYFLPRRRKVFLKTSQVLKFVGAHKFENHGPYFSSSITIIIISGGGRLFSLLL
jgi:hypothetical protein